jgi:sensor histidine kinase YesM
VFWVVVAINTVFGAIGIITLLFAPTLNKEIKLEKLLSWRMITNQCVSTVFSALYYYFTLNVFYKLFADRVKSIHFLKPILVALLSILAYYAASYFLLDKDTVGLSGTDRVAKNHRIPLALMLFAYCFAATFYIGLSLLLSYLTYLRDERKQRKILEEQKMQLEVEKSSANFNFLKAQINPHFLHNTLNFLYSKSLPYSPELSEGILTLSDIMRYALSEGNAKDGKAPLKDEIEHLRNVIKINQLRFSNNLKVELDVEGVINGAQIIPFVLITLVENAFKHGDLKSEDHPIVIKIKVDGKHLYFYCRNKKKTGPKELSTGIGLDNIKKRLDLAYGEKYHFLVKDDADFYTTELIIDAL